MVFRLQSLGDLMTRLFSEGRVMMCDIIAISSCIGIEQLSGKYSYRFHFKGVYRGSPIKEIRSCPSRCLELMIGEEYILQLVPIIVEHKILLVKVKRFTRLGDHRILL